MAFGVKRAELVRWKQRVRDGEISFLTHYWVEPRFPGIRTITKVGCADVKQLEAWCRSWGFRAEYIHHREEYPHFDLMGPRQREILLAEGQWEQVERFDL